MNHKKYHIDKSPFYRLSNKNTLASLLRVEYKLLKKIVLNRNNEYKISFEPKPNSSEMRQIEAPSFLLKRIQRRIFIFLSRIISPNFVKAGKKGESYITNAEYHHQNATFLCVDIEKFYTNVQRNYIFEFFHFKLCMSKDVAWFLTDLVSYQDCLPTGSPCSQILAFWSYCDTFQSIYNNAKRMEIQMSLYVDDITFSAKSTIPRSFIEYLVQRLGVVNLKLKHEKTQIYQKKDYKIVTGCVITPSNDLSVPYKIRAKIRKLINNKNRSTQESLSLRGLLTSARQIDNGFMKHLQIDLL